jgi:hypothetical protein
MQSYSVWWFEEGGLAPHGRWGLTRAQAVARAQIEMRQGADFAVVFNPRGRVEDTFNPCEGINLADALRRGRHGTTTEGPDDGA